jgi:hypothetical protein
MSKPSMRVFHQWEGISLRQYYTATDYEDERLESEAAHEAMKGRMTRESKLFVGMKPWRICKCGCGVWLLLRNETGRHLEADEVVRGLEQYLPKDADDFMQAPVEALLRPAVSVAQVMWARDMVAQYPRKSQEQIARENHTSWEQLQHWARSSTEGLPERASKREPAKQAKPKAKATTRKVKGGAR